MRIALSASMSVFAPFEPEEALYDTSDDCDHDGRRVMTNRVAFDFDAATVLVTGGTSGIGLAIATAFADAGAAVTVTGTRASSSTDASRATTSDLARPIST